jgi:predicted molibdopterin-dependent oxidoreductase YjgC
LLVVPVTIDGISIHVPEGTTVLDAARQLDIYIPTLCHHEALTPYGGCRLCIVEVIRQGISQIVSSCAYTVEAEIEVKTATDKVIKLRKSVIELLLAEAPRAQVIQGLAKEFGVKAPKRFKPRNELCIACGQCIRACRELVGVSAIDFAKRGYERTAASPYFERSDACIGCGTCYAICPTGAITLHDIAEGETFTQPDGTVMQGPARIIDNWKVNFEMKRCKQCGEPFAPKLQLEYFTRNVALADDFYDVCVQCRP